VYVNTPGLSGVPSSAQGTATANYPISATLSGLPSGRAGTIATLKHMREYARAAVRAPDQMIRKTALEIFKRKGVPPRSWLAEIRALHEYVRDCIRYVKDPVGVELVGTPEATLTLGSGDCDDKSTLLAALMLATGHPCRFVAVGMNGAPFSHVLVEAKSGDRWIPAETIIQKPLGWFPERVTSKYFLKV
jgi:transglutaminase-like putative cysteine protease